MCASQVFPKHVSWIAVSFYEYTHLWMYVFFNMWSNKCMCLVLSFVAEWSASGARPSAMPSAISGALDSLDVTTCMLHDRHMSCSTGCQLIVASLRCPSQKHKFQWFVSACFSGSITMDQRHAKQKTTLHFVICHDLPSHSCISSMTFLYSEPWHRADVPQSAKCEQLTAGPCWNNSPNCRAGSKNENHLS